MLPASVQNWLKPQKCKDGEYMPITLTCEKISKSRLQNLATRSLVCGGIWSQVRRDELAFGWLQTENALRGAVPLQRRQQLLAILRALMINSHASQRTK